MRSSHHGLLRRVVGFTVGFVAALVIIVASELSRSANVAESRVVGVPDVFEYCRTSEHELEAALRRPTADGWRCVGRRNDIWGFDEVDFDDVCRAQFGEDTRAVTDDAGSPYAWFCAERT